MSQDVCCHTMVHGTYTSLLRATSILFFFFSDFHSYCCVFEFYPRFTTQVSSTSTGVPSPEALPQLCSEEMVHYPQAWAWPGRTAVSRRAVSLETAKWNYTWSAGAVSWPWASMTSAVFKKKKKKKRLVRIRSCAFSVSRTLVLTLALICGSGYVPLCGWAKEAVYLHNPCPLYEMKILYCSCLVPSCKAKLP